MQSHKLTGPPKQAAAFAITHRTEDDLCNKLVGDTLLLCRVVPDKDNAKEIETCL